MYSSSLNHTFLLGRLIPGAGGRGGLLSTVTFTGILRPKGATFFRLQVYERVAISLVEVYERVGKSVISVGKKAQKANMHFIAVKT